MRGRCVAGTGERWHVRDLHRSGEYTHDARMGDAWVTDVRLLARENRSGTGRRAIAP